MTSCNYDSNKIKSSVIPSEIDSGVKARKFEIVDEPEYYRVTNQITRGLIGRYNMKSESKQFQEFFELKEDGTFHLVLSVGGEVIPFDSQEAEVHAYYLKKESGEINITLSFNLVNSYDVFPQGKLSIDFTGSNLEENVFYGVTDNMEYMVDQPAPFIKE